MRIIISEEELKQRLAATGYRFLSRWAEAFGYQSGYVHQVVSRCCKSTSDGGGNKNMCEVIRDLGDTLGMELSPGINQRIKPRAERLNAPPFDHVAQLQDMRFCMNWGNSLMGRTIHSIDWTALRQRLEAMEIPTLPN